jgi:transcriptional regulator with XRE-family HTH domain
MTTLAGHKVREFRRANRETADAFGARYGVKKLAVYRWETEGRRPSTETIIALARDGVCTLEDWTVPAVPEAA